MRPHYYIIAMVLAIFSIPQAATSQALHEQLIGTWIFDYEASLDMMDATTKDYHLKMDATRRDRISQVYKGRQVTFHADGTYEQALPEGKRSTAQWTIGSDNRIEVATSQGGHVVFAVKEVGLDKLVLEQINTKGGRFNVLFTYWCLTKN